jgi:hypothetical protein
VPIALDADFALLVAQVNWSKPLSIEYNWTERQVEIKYDVAKFRVAAIEGGQITGNPI